MRGLTIMVLFVSCVCFIPSVTFAGEVATPVFVGILKGSVKDYFPDAKIRRVGFTFNSATTGTTVDIPNKLNSVSIKLADRLKEEAIRHCKGYSFVAIDNWDVSFNLLGDAGSVLMMATANEVCFD